MVVPTIFRSRAAGFVKSCGTGVTTFRGYYTGSRRETFARQSEDPGIEKLIDHLFQRWIDRVEASNGRSACHGIEDLR
jgi:hypothetical protein